MRKTIEYAHLSAEVDFESRVMTITDKQSEESITIASVAYPELVAIMSDIGHQIPETKTSRPGYRQ